jgi:hypothetical protein
VIKHRPGGVVEVAEITEVILPGAGAVGHLEIEGEKDRDKNGQQQEREPISAALRVAPLSR